MLVQQLLNYQPAEGVEAHGDLRNVAPLVQVSRLENLLVRNAVLLQGRLEPENKRPSQFLESLLLGLRVVRNRRKSRGNYCHHQVVKTSYADVFFFLSLPK